MQVAHSKIIYPYKSPVARPFTEQCSVKDRATRK